MLILLSHCLILIRYHKQTKHSIRKSKFIYFDIERSISVDEKAKEARRAYSNAWRAANKDRVREYNQRYWKRKAEQMQKKSCNDNSSSEK